MKQKDKRGSERDSQVNNRTSDLQDSARDQERLQPDETTINLPDVEDIPGQEHIHPPALGELADTTISSDDEEGVGLFEQDRDDALKTEDKNDDSYTLEGGKKNAEGNNLTQGIP
jgi:hypothetical protein